MFSYRLRASNRKALHYFHAVNSLAQFKRIVCSDPGTTSHIVIISNRIYLATAPGLISCSIQKYKAGNVPIDEINLRIERST